MLNSLITYLAVDGSAIEGPHSAVTIGGRTGVGKETVQDAEAWGAPGIVFRPRPPEKIGTGMVGAEAVAARTGERLRPLAWRDLRFNRVIGAIKAGTVALVGYAGGLLRFDDLDAEDDGFTPPKKIKQSRAELRVPYKFQSGVAQKAHTIVLDPESETITITHGDGATITLSKERVVKVAADKFEVEATNINLIGTVSAGDASGTSPVALLSDVSALTDWANTHVHTASSGGGPTTPPATPPGPAPVPSGATKLNAL